uniref:Zn-C2H2_12 domain-containing protein n=1 Tax=Anopheles atroparvus TaxID=41427 RepID=A0A182JKT5_ANOAO
MSNVEHSEGQFHTPAASHHALQVALQTLRERCQFFQKRIATLEEENSTLRAAQARSPVATGASQFREKMVPRTGQNELETLRESVVELTRQKTQLADHISMVAAENRQLWRRLSQIAKDVPTSFTDGDADSNTGYHTTARILTDQREQHQRASSSNNQPGQNLIRSRTFTKNAPNPKLRERIQREDSTEDELLNLEDISLLNTCGFLETVGGDLLQLSLLAKQDEEQLQAALEENPDIRRCTEGLSDIRNEIMEQERVLRDIFNSVKLKTGSLCKRCQNLQMFSEEKKQTKDVTVGVAESEFLPVDKQTADKAACTADRSQPVDDRNAALFTNPASGSKGGMQIDLLLQEKLRANCGVDKICPMCGKPYGEETVFDVFQQHVESHFLDDSEMGELSLDRTYEYISQTVGNF